MTLHRILIDDERSFHKEYIKNLVEGYGKQPVSVVTLRNSGEALAYFARALVKAKMEYSDDEYIIHFDHDLGGSDTSIIVTKFLLLNSEVFLPMTSTVYVHTANPVGRYHLMDLLKPFRPVSIAPDIFLTIDKEV